MHEAPIMTIPPAQERALRTFFNRTCGIRALNDKFPGGMPVSIMRKDIPRVFGYTGNTTPPDEMVLSFKADGPNGGRFFLGFLSVQKQLVSFLVDRATTITLLPISDYVHKDAFEGTLFDIEIVDTKEGKMILLFDIMCLHGNPTTRVFYPTRVELCRKFISMISDHHTLVRVVAREKGEYASNFQDMILRLRGFGSDRAILMKTKKIYHAAAISNLQPPRLFKTDGFIWLNAASPYLVFREVNNNLLKWKQIEEITIDFLLERGSRLPWTAIEGISPGFRIRKGNCGMVSIDDNKERILVSFIDFNGDDGVHECYWDGKEWHVKQRRDDKGGVPNHLVTIRRSIRNIEENVSIDELRSYLTN